MAQRKSAKTNVKKPWAMYTYIAGDKDLSEYGPIDIQEMEQAGASKDAHVATQIDTEGEFSGSVRYEFSEPDFEGKSQRTVIQRLVEQNTGAPGHLVQFAKWAAQRYPAQNRLLVVWNHGAGFMHTPTKDIAHDDSSQGDALTMAELRGALERPGFGKALGKLQILGFDACLMNMLEVVYELTDLTELVVGSQQTVARRRLALQRRGEVTQEERQRAKRGHTNREVVHRVLQEVWRERRNPARGRPQPVAQGGQRTRHARSGALQRAQDLQGQDPRGPHHHPGIRGADLRRPRGPGKELQRARG
jgi:hypothetical protein